MRKKRDLLSIDDLTREEILKIFSLTARIKAKPDPTILQGRVLGLIFNKPSTRTRVSFESGILRLGGNSLVLNFSDLQVGRGETLPDTARVLSRFLDAIMIRTSSHEDIIALARNADIPVINGLSDLCHPCQVLTDIYTVVEKRGCFDKIKVAYVGDASNNMANSWITAALKLGMPLTLSCPPEYRPSDSMVKAVKGCDTIRIFDDPKEGVKNADVIYTDVWVSMGQEAETKERVKRLQRYQVNRDLVSCAKPDCLVMHCLPAHREEEITSEVIDGKHSIVFDQAENRMHVQNGILTFFLNPIYAG